VGGQTPLQLAEGFAKDGVAYYLEEQGDALDTDSEEELFDDIIHIGYLQHLRELGLSP